MTHPTTVIAHRGARSLAPENTLAAAQKAHAVGADMWELDVQPTADGQLIVFHDDTLTRTTNAAELFPTRPPWRVADFTLAEIKQLDTGAVFLRDDPFGQIAAGHVSATEQAALRGEPIPTLREALQLTRDLGWRVNVEIKPLLLPPLRTFPVVEKVVAQIEELAMEAQVLVSSFTPLYLKQVTALNPRLEIALLTEGPLEAEALAEYLPPGEPLSPLNYFAGHNPRPLLAELGGRTYHPYHPIISPAQAQALQQAGIALNLWTVNHPADLRRWLAAGIDGLITDFPQTLVSLKAEFTGANTVWNGP